MTHTELLRDIRKIELTCRRLVNELFAGDYHSAFKGRGIEFASVREYVAGDDVRLIDWNATARLDRPFVKQFTEERELTVMLLVDVSGSMGFGTAVKLKRQLATEFCATIAISAMSNNDRVGLILFSDEIEQLIPPKKGRKHVLRLIRELLLCEPQGRRTDLAQALDAACRVMRRHGTIFVVSDFQAAEFEKPLRVAAKRHDCIAVTVLDRHEATPLDAAAATLPKEGLWAFEDPESGRVELIDLGHAGTRRALAARQNEQADRRARLLHQAEVEQVQLISNRSFVEPLVAFFKRRARRLGQGR